MYVCVCACVSEREFIKQLISLFVEIHIWRDKISNS